MKKKSIVFLLCLVLILLTACSTKENQYTGKYITFDYPIDWELKANESINGTQIYFVNDLDFMFTIDLRLEKSLEDEAQIMEEIEEKLDTAYENAKKLQSIEMISYENMEIDGELAKELILETEIVNAAIESLYYILKEDLINHDEVKSYLDRYEGPEEFISEMRNSQEKIEELNNLFLQLEGKNMEETNAKMVAESYIDNIKNRLNEKGESLLKLKTILAIKDNIRLNIYFQGESNDQEGGKKVENIVESIRFVEGKSE